MSNISQVSCGYAIKRNWDFAMCTTSNVHPTLCGKSMWHPTCRAIESQNRNRNRKSVVAKLCILYSKAHCAKISTNQKMYTVYFIMALSFMTGNVCS